MTNRFAAVVLSIACFLCAALAGCRPQAVVPTAAPESAAAIQAQARNKQVQQYIIKRRANARTKSRTHTVH